MSNELDNRIRLLEEKHEYMDHTLEILNQVIIQQQVQIDRIQEELTKLKEEAIAASLDTEDVNEPPPHY